MVLDAHNGVVCAFKGSASPLRALDRCGPNGSGDLELFGLDPNKENEKITPDTANAGSSFSIQKPLDHFSRRKVD